MPQVQAYLLRQGKKVAERAEINAQWVLKESLRLYRMAIGEIPAVQERIVEKHYENDNTYYETDRYELCNTDLRVTLRALEMIGKHSAGADGTADRGAVSVGTLTAAGSGVDNRPKLMVT